MSRQHDPKYKTPAYYIENGKEKFLRCLIDKKRIISDPLGASFKLDDGELLVETDADIDFKIEQEFKVQGEQTLTISNVLSRIPKNKDLNAYRGKPDYVTRFIIK